MGKLGRVISRTETATSPPKKKKKKKERKKEKVDLSIQCAVQHSDVLQLQIFGPAIRGSRQTDCMQVAAGSTLMSAVCDPNRFTVF